MVELTIVGRVEQDATHFGLDLAEDGGGDVVHHPEGGRGVGGKGRGSKACLAWRKWRRTLFFLLLLVKRIRQLLDGVIEVGIVGTVVRADSGPSMRVGRGERH